MKRLCVIIGFILLFFFSSNAQVDTTSSKIQKDLVPVYLSAVLPGAGQIYNGKWWKVPFIYAGLGATGYFYTRLDYQYHVLLQDLVTMQNGYSYSISGIQDISTLRSTKDQFRNWRDLTAIGFTLVWLFNVVDAYVDAEFKDFDVSPDLSMNYYPMYDYSSGRYIPAISVSFKF